jgi:hypothetical protein
MRQQRANHVLVGVGDPGLCADEDEVEGRAILAFSLAIGYHFIAADHGERNRDEAVELAVQQLLG